MLKFFGVLMIVGVCGYLGYCKQKQLSNRVEQLQQMIFFIENLASEMDYGKEPMNIVLEKISSKSCAGICSFLQSVSSDLSNTSGKTLSEIWQQKQIILSESTNLTNDDLLIIAEYGRGLGVSHTDDQLKKLANFSQKLEIQYKYAEDDYQRLGKVFQTSGFCIGIVLALLLL